MAVNVREVERDQLFLMPPSVADWLPKDHLAWFVLDVVEELDCSAFFSGHREDGRGGSLYHPKVMLAVLLYAYCTGERSSRRIERRLHEDVAYRVLAANQTPDHATIARFRQHHEEAIAGLFDQVLALCVEAGIVDISLVAIDGTKMQANASPDANRTRRQLVDEILAEAGRVDVEEDRRFGDRRGDELPEQWASREGRRARIAEALRQLDEAATTGSEYVANKERLANTTDPDSRSMPTTGRRAHRFLQGYNAQAAATADQVIVAAEVTQETNDVRQLEPVIKATREHLASAGIEMPVGAFLAGAGYWSAANASIETESELLIATAPSRAGSVTEEVVAEREETIERVLAGEVSARAAAKLLGLSGVFVSRLARDRRRGLPDPHAVRAAMDAKLAEDRHAKRLAKRKQMIEPVFGQLKANRGYRRFSRRGRGAVQSEWRLICATHNLLKLRRLAVIPD